MKRTFHVGASLAVLVTMLAAPMAAAEVPVPEQAHVTLAEDGQHLILHWAVSVEYASAEEPHVVWSTSEGEEGTTPAELVGAIQPDQTTDFGVYSDPPHPTFIYGARIGPLAPGTDVTYEAGSAERGYTDTYTVRMVPGVNESLRFVAFADIGIDQTNPDGSCRPGVDSDERAVEAECRAHQVRDVAVGEEPDLFIIPGDLAYTNTRRGWDSFMRFMVPLQATTVTMPAWGNHEWEDDLAYHYADEEYVLPGNEHEYAFQAGPVTFISVNSNQICGDDNTGSSGNPVFPCSNGSPNEEQLAFLEAALINATADETPWTVVYFHHPPYSWGRHGDHYVIQHFWVPLFEKYEIDLVVTGHDHLYSRSHPIRDGNATVVGTSNYTQGDGPVYVVTGGGGRSLYDMPEDEEPPAWYAAGEEVHHMTVYDVTPEEIHLRALRYDGSLLDEFVISAASPDEGADGDGDEDPAVPGPSVLLVVAALLGLAVASARGRRLAR